MTSPGLTTYVTPAMLLASNFGISWSTFPKQGASASDQLSAQLDICSTVTSEMDTLANQTLRATVDVEQEFGPDQQITILRNGWARFRLSHWPILQLVGAQVSPAGSNPFSYTTIPATALITEHNTLPEAGTTVPAGAGPGPTAALIAPGYVSWANGRKGYFVQVTSVNGFPLAGIDAPVVAGATSIHVDDITGWVGARGTVFDPPWRESITVTAVTPDVAGAIAGPGTMTLSSPLQFGHTPAVGGATEPDQRILVSTMPQALIQAGYYLATHYGLIRGATASVMQTARATVVTSGVKSAMDWYDRGSEIIGRYGRVL